MSRKSKTSQRKPVAPPRARVHVVAPSGPPRQPARQITARYDIAQTTPQNRVHWASADNLSAKAANSIQVRKTSRIRARYEVANNSYARGMTRTLAEDLIGTGPRLQLQLPRLEQPEDNPFDVNAVAQAIECLFRDWSREICLAEKLRVMRMSRCIDGEAFALLITNPALRSPIKLDLQVLEADQIHTPTLLYPDQTHEDGMELDAAGNVIEYHVLKQHPGDQAPMRSLEFDPIPSERMIHWFRKDRPGQLRGVTELAPSLQLFAELRRFRDATIAAAETAADHAAILYRDAPAADEGDEVDPFTEIEIQRRMMVSMPLGWQMQQMKAEHPTTTYKMFVDAILQEIARCLGIPFNVAAGNSSGYNYSSGRLDHQTYFKGLRVDLAQCEDMCLLPILRAFLEEAELARIIPRGMPPVDEWKHTWVWDGRELVDPKGEADASIALLGAGLLTDAEYFASNGQDWRDVYRQRQVEQSERSRLGLAGASAASVAAPQPTLGGDPTANPAAGPVQDLALNGAQITSMVAILTAVSQKTIPPAAARGVIDASFPSLTAEQIEAIVGPFAALTPAAPGTVDPQTGLPAATDTALPAPSGELAGLSRQQLVRNLKALDDVLNKFHAGEYSDVRARTMLSALGFSAATIDGLLSEEPAAEPVAAEGAAPSIQGSSQGSTATIAASGVVDGGTPARTVTIVAYTGGPLHIEKWDLPVIVDYDGLEIPATQVPILIDHKRTPDGILGQTSRVVVANGELQAVGTALGCSDLAKQVIAMGVAGYRFQASIAGITSNYERVQPGQSVFVNGQSFVGPVIVARSMILQEISLVTVGGDTATAAVIASGQNGVPPMKTFEVWCQENGFDAATLSETQRPVLQAAYDAAMAGGTPAPTEGSGTPPNPNPAPNPAVAAAARAASLQASGANGNGAPTQPDPLAAGREAQAADIERIAAIRNLCGGRHPTIEAAAIRQGHDTNQVELAILRAERTTVARPGTHSPNRNITAAAIEASLLMASGIRQDRVGQLFDQQTMNVAVGADVRGYSIHQLIFETIQAAGLHCRPGRVNNETIRTARQADRQIQAAGGFSTVSLSGILGNVANKALLDSFTAVEVVWNIIAAIRSHGDFKPHTNYRLDSAGAFKKVGSDGELKNSNLSEASFDNRLDTYGTIVALTRQMIINDDLGAFLQLPALLGRMSALRIEEAVFSLILANTGTFYGTGNKNFMDGASSPLAIDSLTTAKQMFLDMVDSNGKPVLVSPAILLVPSTLRVTAEQLCKEDRIIAGTSTAKGPANNPHAGTLKTTSSTYLNNTSIRDQDGNALSNQSSVAWYLFANPATRAAVAVAFLDGAQTPTIESAETDFNTLGMQWRAYHDFGVGFEEPYGSVKSKGSV